MPLAIWRSKVAESQAKTAQQALLNERYQTAAEMLGNDVVTVRLGGIFALQELGRRYPVEYHIQALKLLCAFVCNPTKQDKRPHDYNLNYNCGAKAPPDIQAAMDAIGRRIPSGIELERAAGHRLELRGANLRSTNLDRANLKLAWLIDADLTGATLGGANLELARLDRAKLVDPDLPVARLENATLHDTNVSNACFNMRRVMGSTNAVFPAEGLTGPQLSQACAEGDRVPDIGGVVDDRTGEPLEWNGRGCNDRGVTGVEES